MDDLETHKMLSSGSRMPVIGLGTYPMDDDEAERVVGEAVSAGYRLVDTAENYRNETGVGRGMRASGVPRHEIFLTTKFNAKWHAYDLVRQAFEQSAERLGVDYIDLLLIHWPNPGQDRYVEAWQGLLDLRSAGLVRAVGVSNFKATHLQRLIDETGFAPEVNQIQLHPYLRRSELREFNEKHAIVTEAWSPIGKGRDLLENPVIATVAAAHLRTPAQIVLRWQLQHGHVAIPKTSNLGRLLENMALFDFALSDADMKAIDALDTGEENATDSDAFGH